MIDINSLQKYEFHDQILSSLVLDFENRKISVSVSLYSETIDDYLILKFIFMKISNLKMEEFEFDELRELTIGSFNFKENSGEYFAELILIDTQNFSAISKIKFKFIDLKQEP